MNAKETSMKQYFNNSAGMIVMILLLAACKKDKSDFGYDNRPVIENLKKSNVRIINLAGFNQVVANGDSLTNFVVKGPNDPTEGRYPATKYFPNNGRMGKIWEVPMDLFDGAEKLSLDFAWRSSTGVGNGDVSLTAENSYTQPTDYYLLPFTFMTGQPGVLPVPRNVHAPTKPDHFRIRIINLTGDIISKAYNPSGPQEDLRGSVTLTYADGTAVSAQTSNIGTGSPVSEYIELPYGTYQFKVLTGDGRQFPSPSSALQDRGLTMLDPPTSSIAQSLSVSTHLVYAPIGVYQPGGIYTIVVTPQRFNYFINEVDEESFAFQNAFQVINDNNPAANLTYCRMQGVNATGATAINIKANGKPVGGSLEFGTAGDYITLVHGNYTIEATDASGKVLASTEQVLRAAQNYTAWLYPNKDGSYRLLIVANDLSGTWYNGSADDGSFDRFQFDYFFFKRFLNLSPDNPYITFTQGNGQPAEGVGDNASSSVNLQPGIPVFEKPYVRSGRTIPVYEIMAYRSAPDIVPGTWADDIPVLSSQDLIARKSLYTDAGRVLPAQEPGVYTVALIGRSGNGSPKAKMMIVKHNK
jgi:hypothetical protein